MSAFIKTLKNTLGDIIYPQTKTSAVFDSNNINLDTKLTKMEDKIVDIQISVTQPTNQKTGDIWYRVL